MADLQRIDFIAERNLYFIQPVTFIGENWTGATNLNMRVKKTVDSPAAPYVDLSKVTDDSEGIRLLYAGADTVANHITAGHLDETIYNQTNTATGLKYEPTDNITLSELRILLLADSRFPYPDERGNNVEFAYDLIVTPAATVGKKVMYGKFIVHGTVTF